MDNVVTLGDIFAKAQDSLTPSFNSVQFEADVDNLNKAETENLLGTIQAEILKGGDYDMLTEMRNIAIDHIVDIEKGGGRHAVGEQKNINGKTYIWTEYAPGKFDWRPVKKNAAEKVPDKEEVRKYLEDKAPAGTKVTDEMIDKVINNVVNKNKRLVNRK